MRLLPFRESHGPESSPAKLGFPCQFALAHSMQRFGIGSEFRPECCVLRPRTVRMNCMMMDLTHEPDQDLTQSEPIIDPKIWIQVIPVLGFGSTNPNPITTWESLFV